MLSEETKRMVEQIREGKQPKTQQQLITSFQKSAGLTDQELANYLKYSIHTIRAWKRPELNQAGERNKNFQYMPEPVYDYVQMMIDNF